jgi:hypothetical protein
MFMNHIIVVWRANNIQGKNCFKNSSSFSHHFNLKFVVVWKNWAKVECIMLLKLYFDICIVKWRRRWCTYFD